MKKALYILVAGAIGVALSIGTSQQAFAIGTHASSQQVKHSKEPPHSAKKKRRADPVALPAWLQNFDGQFRLYEFQRVHNGNVDTPPVNSALAGAAKLFMQTKALYGLSVGLGVYAVSGLGLTPEVARRDTSLMGTQESFATPAQAYLRYKLKMVEIKVGNQLLNTPWANPSDSRMIPVAFQAVSLSVKPISGLVLDAAYWGRWKDWENSDFNAVNLYNVHTSGTWYAGANYDFAVGQGRMNVQAWYYGFTGIADMTYAQLGYSFNTESGWDPLIGAQYGHESDSGAALLGYIDARLYGAIFGVKHGAATYTLAYDKIPSSAGAYQNGNIVSPYTNPLNTGPLYTNSMIHGLINMGMTGSAWKAKAVYWLGGNRQWRLIGSYAYYKQDQYIQPGQSGNPWEVDFDVTYFVRSGSARGFSVRDRIGLFTYPGAPKKFIYNRLQFQYVF